MHGITSLRILTRLTTHTLTLAIDKQLHFIGVIIVAPHINLIAWYPVPMREEMQHGLRRPLTLIHIISIFRETGKVYDTEITGACRKTIGCRFSNIIKARPDILSAHKGIMLHHVPSLLMRRTP